MPELQAETVSVIISGTDMAWTVGQRGVKAIDANSMNTQDGFRIIRIIFDDDTVAMFSVAPLLLVQEIRERKIIVAQPSAVNDLMREPIDIATLRNGKGPA